MPYEMTINTVVELEANAGVHVFECRIMSSA